MTTDIEKCKAILRTVREANNHLTVTFVRFLSSGSLIRPDIHLPATELSIQPGA